MAQKLATKFAGAILPLALTCPPLQTDMLHLANPSPNTSPNVYVLSKPFKIKTLDRTRTIRIYLPPDYYRSQRHYPVIYMHDAQNLFDPQTSFSGEWHVDETLDRLYLQKGLAVIIVGIDNGGEYRLREYTAWEHPKIEAAEAEEFTEFIIQDLKPFVDEAFRTKPSRINTAMMGSSMGGLLTHFAFFRYPEVFGKAGIFSPSYWITRGKVYPFTREAALRQPSRLYLMAGGKEGHGTVLKLRLMEQLLKSKGFTRDDLYVRVVPGGHHNESFWGTWFGEAAMFLFGG